MAGITIRNDRDLRIAYELVREFTEMGFGDKECIKEHKRAIRAYVHKPEPDYRVIRYDMDGYVLLQELPDVSDPEAYFDEHERLVCRPSMYDCTGQAFTEWHKIFKRHGKTMVYHCIGIDV